MSFMINSFLSGYRVSAVTFDGTNDSLSRGASLTGNAAGKKAIISFWIKMNGGDSVTQFICASINNARFSVTRNVSNKFQFTGQNNVASTILNISTSSSYTATGSWVHVLASWDLSTTTARIYINNTSNITSTTVTNDTIQYNQSDFVIGTAGGGLAMLNSDIAELYINLAESLDISSSGNREKFIDQSSLKPINLGVDGSLPTGTAPIVFLKSPASSFNTNLGTGGNFTVTGALTDASTSPSD